MVLSMIMRRMRKQTNSPRRHRGQAVLDCLMDVLFAIQVFYGFFDVQAIRDLRLNRMPQYQQSANQRCENDDCLIGVRRKRDKLASGMDIYPQIIGLPSLFRESPDSNAKNQSSRTERGTRHPYSYPGDSCRLFLNVPQTTRQSFTKS